MKTKMSSRYKHIILTTLAVGMYIRLACIHGTLFPTKTQVSIIKLASEK